jgi:hypothetical protein
MIHARMIILAHQVNVYSWLFNDLLSRSLRSIRVYLASAPLAAGIFALVLEAK